MSVDISSVPPWKRELMERKRRQEEEDRRKRDEEIKQLSEMPLWKRDILMKKQKTKNSVVFLGSSASRHVDVSPDRSKEAKRTANASSLSPTGPGLPHNLSPSTSLSSGTVTSIGSDSKAEFDSPGTHSSEENMEGTVQEHLIPIQRNPWLLSDLEKRHQLSRSPRSGYAEYYENDLNQPLSLNIPNHCSDTDGRVPALHNQDNGDDVFTEEVTYGRGFVHKLLRKFKHLSSREEQNALGLKPTSPKRTLSSDNILDDRRSGNISPRDYLSPDKSHDSSLSRQRAHSMENLPVRTRSSTSSASSSDFLTSTSNQVSSIGSLDNICESDSGVGNHDSPSGRIPADDKDNKVVLLDKDGQGAPEDVTPRSNIVSLARSVFESISTHQSPPGVSKKPESTVAKPVLLKTTVVHRNDQVEKENGGKSELETSMKKAEPERNFHYENGLSSTPSNMNNLGDIKYDDASETARSMSDINANKASFSNRSTIYSHSKPETENGRKDQERRRQDLSSKFSAPTRRSYAVMEKDAPLSGSEREKTPSIGIMGAEVYAESLPKSSAVETVVPDQSVGVEKVVRPPRTKGRKAEQQLVTEDINSQIPAGSAGDCRNPEANRLNLNLNLNELQSKKNKVDKTNSDLNRNNALNSIVKESTPKSPSSTDEIPVPPRRGNKKGKRPASSGPGSLLIRPASNLVVGSVVDAKYLNLTTYNDVKVGEFEPAKKRPGYYDEDFEEYIDDVPVTNIDDVLSEDVPVTNIDDNNGQPLSPREGDAQHYKIRRKKYEFIGAGVVEKSSLSKGSRLKGRNICFNDTATSMFEYPSEQFLMDSLPPEPGDLDFPTPPGQGPQNGQLADDEPDNVPDFMEATLMSTPGMGASGALAGYKTKTKVDYYFGMERPEDENNTRGGQAQPEMTEETQAKPSQEEVTWSDATTSDMLF